jgi:predicted nucleotidyltransferase
MSSADFLFTQTVQRILGATLGTPTKAFTLLDLVRLGGAGRGGTQLQVEKLLKAGVLVEDARAGNQRRIRANTDHFLYVELRSIAIKSFGLVAPIREAVRKRAPRVREAFVFGSIAKGTDSHASDVDLMLIGQMSAKQRYDLSLELLDRLGREVHINVYGEVEWKNLLHSDPVLAQIARGPKLKVLPSDD